MCEILAIEANQNVGIALSWSAHQLGATKNPHGWGAAWLVGDSFQLRRAPERLPAASKGQDLVRDVFTTRLLAHTRYRVRGSVSMANTQPFGTHDGRYVFAGTMSRCRANRFRADVRQRLRGQTGPEILFHFLLASIESGGRAGLKAAIKKFFDSKTLPRAASASFVLCTPDDTYVFRHHKQLFYRTRVPPYDDQPIFLRGEIHSPYRLSLQKSKNQNERATIIATECLTSEEWTGIDDRTLFAVTFS